MLSNRQGPTKHNNDDWCTVTKLEICVWGQASRGLTIRRHKFKWGPNDKRASPRIRCFFSSKLVSSFFHQVVVFEEVGRGYLPPVSYINADASLFFILQSRASDSGAILWTNLYPLKGWPMTIYQVFRLTFWLLLT